MQPGNYFTLSSTIVQSAIHVLRGNLYIDLDMAETVTDRRIGPIRDLARNNSWKQALKECEKWQKKGEKSDRFLVRAHQQITLNPY